jgi:hypothetical protein
MTSAFRRGALAVAVLAAAVAVLCGCTGLIDRPGVDFAWCPRGAEGDLDYVFTPMLQDLAAHVVARAVWEFGDGTEPAEGVGPLVHRFPAPGLYAVTLTVTDRRGVSGTETQWVSVEFAAFIDPTWTLTLGYPPTVSGVVGHRSTGRLDEVVVRARFYDADGVRLGDERATIHDLEPAERARFKIETRDFPSRVFYASVEIESFVSACDVVGGGE